MVASKFGMRLVPYVLSGARIGTKALPVSTMTANIPFSDISSLPSVTMSAGLAAIPEEVALQVNSGAGWIEPPNCRFYVNRDKYNDTDPAKIHTFSARHIWGWFLERCMLSHVAEYTLEGLDSIASYSITGATASGTIITKVGHNIIDGDRLKLDSKSAAAKNVVKGSVYYAKQVSGDTFKVAGSLTGDARNIGTGTLNFSRVQDRVVAGGNHLIDDEKVIVLARGGAAGIKTRGGYYVKRFTANSFGLSASRGGSTIVMGSVTNMTLTRAIDGDRKFSKATPGAILKTVIDEAKARDALSPGDDSTALTYDFTATLDSDGNAWPKRYSLPFKPFTNGLTLVNSLVEKGFVEIGFDGRVMHAWPKGHGVDRTIGATPVVIGGRAEQLPIEISRDNLSNSYTTILGDGSLLDSISVVLDRHLGILERGETQSGVTDTDTSESITNNGLSTSTTPEVTFTVTEKAQVSKYLPFFHYQPGDNISVHTTGGDIPQFDAEVQLRLEANGVISIDNVLGARVFGLLIKLAGKQNRRSAGVNDVGTSDTVLFSDNSYPVPPVFTSAVSTGVWDAKTAKATLELAWDPVTVDGDGDDITVTSYEVYTRAVDDLEPKLAVSTADESATIGGLDAAATYYVSQRALSSNGEWGLLSAEAEITTATPIEGITAGSTPVGPQTVATLNDDGTYTLAATTDEAGNQQVQALTVTDGISIQGIDLLGSLPDFTRNGVIDDAPFFDRVALGIIQSYSWTPQSFNSTSTPRRVIAQGSFDIPVGGRTIRLDATLGSQYLINSGPGNLQYVLKLSNVPITVSTTGSNYVYDFVDTGDSKVPHLAPVFVNIVDGLAVNDPYQMAPGTIYWMILINASSGAPNYQLSTTYAAGGQCLLTVTDAGMSGPIFDATNNDTTGATGGGSSGGKTTTKYSASWSKSWRNDGADAVSGGGQFANPETIYQGYGSSPMGAKVGFPALGLAGRKITSAYMQLKNNWAYDSDGVVARLGTHGNASPPATFTGARADAFNVRFSPNASKKFKLPPSLYPDMQSGAMRGITFGPSGEQSDYGQFAGADQSNPPLWFVTHVAI